MMLAVVIPCVYCRADLKCSLLICCSDTLMAATGGLSHVDEQWFDSTCCSQLGCALAYTLACVCLQMKASSWQVCMQHFLLIVAARSYLAYSGTESP